jgi:hypothetical protein
MKLNELLERHVIVCAYSYLVSSLDMLRSTYFTLVYELQIKGPRIISLCREKTE